MKRTQLLSTVAAVLMFSAGAALAQAPAPAKDQAPAQPAPAAQQNAPAEKIAPVAKPDATAKPTPDGNDVNKLAPGRGQNAQTGTPKPAADAKTDMKVPSAAAKSETKIEPKSETKSSADAAKTDETKPDATKSSDTNKSGASASTTGQGAGAAARLAPEQRTKIVSVIREQKVQPVKLDISISIGTRVPSTVRYYPLPREVIVIYPEWRGYDYILVGSQVLILDPGTHEIVAILDV